MFIPVATERPDYVYPVLTVTTVSGATYVIRGHGPRAYITRLGSVAIYGTPPVNAVTTGPVHLIEGEPMTAMTAMGPLRTTNVVSIDYTIERYPA